MQAKIDPQLIDQLVDDELSPAERRRAIALVESDPDGWRRLGLAFLEAQAWRSAASDVAVSRTETLPFPSPPAVAPPSPRRIAAFWLKAACLLAVAFGVGYATRGKVRPTKPEVATVVAPPAPSPNDLPPGEEHEVRTVGRVEFTTAQSGEFPAVQVPLLSGISLADHLRKTEREPFPDDQKARWERQGYQVEERTGVVSLDLDDGRRAVVPVDEVRVKYVGQVIY